MVLPTTIRICFPTNPTGTPGALWQVIGTVPYPTDVYTVGNAPYHTYGTYQMYGTVAEVNQTRVRRELIY